MSQARFQKQHMEIKKSKVLLLLRNGPLTTTALRELTLLRQETLARYLIALRKEGWVESTRYSRNLMLWTLSRFDDYPIPEPSPARAHQKKEVNEILLGGRIIRSKSERTMYRVQL